MTFDQKKLLLEIAARLRGEAIRHEHEIAEAIVRDDWLSIVRHRQKRDLLHKQADAIGSTVL